MTLLRRPKSFLQKRQQHYDKVLKVKGIYNTRQNEGRRSIQHTVLPRKNLQPSATHKKIFTIFYEIVEFELISSLYLVVYTTRVLNSPESRRGLKQSLFFEPPVHLHIG